MDSTHQTEQQLRKERGAFFTPLPIARFLARHTIGRDQTATVLDPTCGDGVFLQAAGEHLRALGADASELSEQVTGIDLHQPSLDDAQHNLQDVGLSARTLKADFFSVPSPNQLGCPVTPVDAVVGNPPFVRYQEHKGAVRKAAAEAALREGVRLSGLASSWAAALVHASSFLKPDGRLGMVLPAELLSVHYAEPVRRWLQSRFASVHLVFFEQLQFSDATENVVLLLAKGEGSCEAFSLYFVDDASDLDDLALFDEFAVAPAGEGKWTDLLLPMHQRQTFR